MPDHIHGIIIIDKPIDRDGDLTNNDFDSMIETQNFASPPKPKNKFGPQSKNLASIIRGYKTGVTKNAKSINPEWKWQPKYHDHIIRNYRIFFEFQQKIWYRFSNTKMKTFL